MTVCTHGTFIVLPHWEIRLEAQEEGEGRKECGGDGEEGIEQTGSVYAYVRKRREERGERRKRRERRETGVR